MTGIREYQKMLDSSIADRQYLRAVRAKAQQNIKQYSKDIVRAVAARELFLKASALTQQKLAAKVANLVSLALCSVLPDNYEFKVEFVTRRNSTECDFKLFKNGKERDPLESVGGGVVDIENFALRLAYWSMNPNRPTIIIDEPMKWLSVDLQERASEMLKMVSTELGLQIIMISHLPNIIGSADKIFKVTTKNDLSKITEC